MKRLLRIQYITLFLLLVLLTACGQNTPATTESEQTSAVVSESKTPETSTVPTTPKEHYINVPIITYTQDPESGEYEKTGRNRKTG